MMSAGEVSVGIHGFNGGKSATVLLVPGVHDLKIEYVQVSVVSPPLHV